MRHGNGRDPEQARCGSDRSPRQALGEREHPTRARADAVADPREGVAADGTIVTGADRTRVPVEFEPLLAEAAALAGECRASLYVYGSVANGTVRPGLSDVDLLSVGLADPPAVGRILSARYAGLCRGVEISWHLRRWRQALESETEAEDLLGVRVARKRPFECFLSLGQQRPGSSGQLANDIS